MRKDTEIISYEDSDDIAEMKSALQECCGLAVKAIHQMAALVKRLTDLGEDVTEYGLGINASRREALVNVANKVFATEAYAAFGHKAGLLKHLATLDQAEQLRLAKGGLITVMISHQDGDSVLKSPDQLSASEIKQVFDETGGLRSKLGQLAFIGYRRTTSTAPEPEVNEVRYGKGFVEFTGPMIVTTADLLEMVSRLTSRK